MAVIWERREDGVLYQVRRQGARMRLFANGVQHSEFHPKRLVTGSVWDLLWLPALLGDPARLRRVLILGLGGGSLVPPLRALLAPERLVAVELDAHHLAVAREVFSVVQPGEQTVLGDAVAWLQAYDGEPFDLIIEDLFAPSNEAVSRAVPADKAWLATLERHVSDHGTLVMNFGITPNTGPATPATRRPWRPGAAASGCPARTATTR
ncbi:Polyamine aminopropyltransferase [Alcanivorax sp. ALC70]|nr:Polyamine aminopropyltransferase [Alcanivorax sp. ALC70]